MSMVCLAYIMSNSLHRLIILKERFYNEREHLTCSQTLTISQHSVYCTQKK